ncbi:MAG: trypsin-like peptidase domain-containing protein [Bacteroidales bacterium]|nr:trypsin-like peptidase domain-containing protein [Bacteroidales bacterium]
MKRNLAIILVSVILSGLTAFFVSKYALNHAQPSALNRDGQPVKTVNLSVEDYPDFTYAAENTVDAVVYVQVKVKSRAQLNNPFFEFFFGEQYKDQFERLQQGSGSGVIIKPEGYIVTNNHVVADATEIQVVLNNNKTYPATVVGTDPATDVALIKIEAEEELPAIEFADSDALRLGEWVLAIGSPLGKELQSTITAGIVSAKGRSMPNYTGEFKIESFIQTDAAVNPGNSGGALVNKAGQLVGINTAIISTTGSYAGYSFAVPSNIVSKIVSDLIEFGNVKRAKLGVSMSAITTEMAKEKGLKSLEGAYIHEVATGSAAEKAGIKPGDVIVGIDDTPINTPAALQEKVNSYRPGDTITVKVNRGGETLNLQCTFFEEPTTPITKS